MKRALSVLMAIVMAVSFGAFTGMTVSAKTGNSETAGVEKQITAGDYKTSKVLRKAGETAEKNPKAKEVIVQFADSDSSDLSKADAKKIETIQAMAEGSASKGNSRIEIANGITVEKGEVWEFGGDEDGTLTVAVASSKNLSTNKMIKKLQSQKIVEAVSPNYSRHICSEEYGAYQWAMDGYPGTGVKTEWKSGNKGSKENIVAMVDTGIDYNHADLKGQMWSNPFGSKLKGAHGFDFVNGDNNPMDDNGHGTHCSGIIGAATNGTGVQGVNQKVSLMALKVLDGYGSGYDADIIAAYNYIYKAMDLGANVVAVNCSFVGDGDDEVMGQVIDKIGEKGTVVVCAAGNEATNCDEEPSYPACYDSEYIISVAATKKSGNKAELVSFSNYGRESVDIAAPGTDILSTVCYDCFNPTLYGSKGNITQSYFDGSAASVKKLMEQSLTNMDPAEITSDTSAGFLSKNGAIKIHFDPKGIDSDKYKWQYAAIPYDLPADYNVEKDEVAHSMMIRTEGPEKIAESSDFFGGYNQVLLLDVPRSYLDETTPEGAAFLSMSGDEITDNYACDYQIVYGKDDYWSHITTALSYSLDDGTVGVFSDGGKDVNKMDRVLLILGDSQAGDFTAYIDDIGISQCVSDTSIFGQYDFYSGTSMATPYVTGAVALTAAADKGKTGYGPEMLIGDVLSMANDTVPFKIGTEGALDFAKKGTGFWVGISSVTADTAKNQIKINGRFGAGSSDKLEIKIKKDGEAKAKVVPDGQIVSKSESEIVLKNSGWINNIIDVTVSVTRNGKTRSSTKNDIYVVKGKKSYETLKDLESAFSPEAAITTDGTGIYAAMSAGDSIQYLDSFDSEEGAEEIAVFDKETVEEYFESADPDKLSKTAEYDFRFGDDLVQLGGDLYVKGSFCEVAPSISDDDDDDWSVRGGEDSDTDDSDEDDDRFSDSDGAAYAEEMHLFRIEIDTGEISPVDWPGSAATLTDTKLTYYNGSLYLLGGIDEAKDSFSSKVYCFDASAEKWSAKASMPKGRAGGKVMQTGDKLIYALGYDADSEVTDAGKESIPANYIFDGKTWKKSSKNLSPIDTSYVSRGSKDYIDCSGSVGVCANGLVYIAVPVRDYGDTFTYDVNSDSYKTTKYNYTKTLDDVWALNYKEGAARGLVLDDTIVCFDAEGSVSVIEGAVKSGMFNVTAGQYKGGTIIGAGPHMPGSLCQIKAAADPGYYAKSLKVTGASAAETVNGGLAALVVINKDISAKAGFAKFKFKAKKKLKIKAGKSKSLKAKIKPAAAAKQWNLEYVSSNTNYATVSEKGKVKTYKAGKGKKVKIKIMLGDTDKVLKTVKVKIK